jgi:hypothetical protein
VSISSTFSVESLPFSAMASRWVRNSPLHSSCGARCSQLPCSPQRRPAKFVVRVVV